MAKRKLNANELASQLFKRIQQGAGKLTQGFTNPVRPSVPQNNLVNQSIVKLGQSPVGRGIVGFQKGIEQRTLPKINLTQFSNRISAPVPRLIGNLGAGIVQETVNLPQRLLEGGGRIGTQVVRPLQQGRQINPYQAVGAAASAAEPIFDIATLGSGIAFKQAFKQGGKQLLKQGGKQTLKSALTKGALVGAGYGGVAGGLRGLAEGDQADFLKGVQGATVGGLAGGVIGAGSAGLGRLLSLISKTPEVEKQLRDSMGRWTKEKTPVKPKGMSTPSWEFQIKFNEKYNRNPYTPVYQDDLVRSLGYEAEKKGLGMSIRDVTKDIDPLGKAKNIAEEGLNNTLEGNIQQPSAISLDQQAVQPRQMGQIQESAQTPELTTQTRAGVPSGGIISTTKNIVNITKGKVDEIYTKSLDRFHPISKLGKEAKQDQAMRNALTGYYGAGSTGKYHTDFELAPILKSVDADDLRKYTIAQRDIELAGRGIQGSNQGEASKIISELQTKYGGNIQQLDDAANKLYDYQKKLIKEYLVDTGVVSQEAFEGMLKNNQKYVPFKRVMDQVDEFLGVPATKGAGSVGSQNIIQKIKGSKREIIDPLQSIIENTYKTVGLGQRQRVAQTIVSLKDSLPAGIIQKVNGPVGNKPTISVFENGKVQKYLVPPEVSEAAKGLSEEGMNTLIKILAGPTRIFRATATGANPEFAIPNVARDLQSTFINNGLNPLRFVSGLAHYMKEDQVYQDFLKAGGQTSRLSLDEKFLKQEVADLTGRKVSLRIVDPRRIYKILQAVGQASEQPTRIASFQKARDAALKQGLSAEEAAIRGAYAAQEGSVNFARRGSQTQGFNAILAFLNARAQGVDRLIRSAKNDPKGVGFRIGLITLAPAIGLYAHNRNFKSFNDPRIVPDYEKENNFIIMLSDTPIPQLGGAQYIKVPKGETGKIANPVEAFMSYADGRGGNIQGALLSVLKGFSPISGVGDMIPTALKPVVENATNYNFFTNRQIVPEPKLNYPKAYQSNKNTPAIYKELGQRIGQSPNMIENLARGYFTGFARQAEYFTQPFAKKDNYSGQDINQAPLIRRFFGGATKSEDEQLQSDTYKLKDIKSAIDDIRSGIKYGNIPEDVGIREIQKLQGQVEEEAKKNPQSYFGVSESEASTTTPSSIADQIKIDNLKYQIKQDRKPQEFKGKIYYPKGDQVNTIDLTSRLDDPVFVNKPELDKKTLSDFQGMITKKGNEAKLLTTLVNPKTGKPWLTTDQAETILTGLKSKLESIKAKMPSEESKFKPLKLTGNPTIDKELISDQLSAYSSEINKIVDYVTEGKLTPEQGEDIINRIKAKQNELRGKSKSGGGSGRKRKVNYNSVRTTAKPIRIPTISVKIPKTKIPKYKPIKVKRVKYR